MAARPTGDLKATLLEHGIALAREGGPSAVSLRDVQRRAGVSNTAAYRHYADRDALLVAISAYASAQMAATMERLLAAADEAEPGQTQCARRRRARARFRATGAAYLEFAQAEPGLFTVAMHPGVQLDKLHPPVDARGAGGLGPFQLLVACVDELVEAGVLSPVRRPFTDVAAWSAVHGLAVLILDGPLTALGAPDRKAATDRLLDLIDGGLD